MYGSGYVQVKLMFVDMLSKECCCIYDCAKDKLIDSYPCPHGQVWIIKTTYSYIHDVGYVFLRLTQMLFLMLLTLTGQYWGNFWERDGAHIFS